LTYNPNHKTLVVISGPTSSGKTSLAIQTALGLQTEIISADSRQFYQEMTIGTAKPSKEELASVPHHFINSLSIADSYSAGDFEREALEKIHALFAKQDYVVMVGGSGLYIKAVTTGFDQFPDIPIEVRENLKLRLENEGLEALVADLHKLDPTYATEVDVNNSQRVIRALEIINSTGESFSALRKKQEKPRNFQIKQFAIDWPRDVLYQRINERVEQMVAAGLEKEARGLYSQKHLNALQTVGYAELFDFFDGKIDRNEAIRLIKRNTRRYAKRQLTWFRNQEQLTWLQPGDPLPTFNT